MEWINFRHLYSFWMVQKSGGFNAASKKMFVSQSTVSEQVVQLEDYLEEPLFERTTRVLKLTQAGDQLFQMAEEIFNKSREINRIIRDKEGGAAPLKFRIGIVGGVSRNLLFRLFKEFLDSQDEAELEVVNGDIDELVKQCHDFELDFLITT
ncbi:MAG: LysR family transcriptional regulator, partial [Halobacteriovoraceae bacterium]|nr:LysR family transcriptional regulator [Halobacteriovoraceae bacterium]